MLALLALSLAAAAPDGGLHSTPFRTRAAVPPAQVTLPKDAHPLLSNPQINVDGSKIYVARLDAPPGTLTTGIHISIVFPSVAGKPQAAPLSIDMPAPVLGDDVQVLLSPNERTIATLAAGELWVRGLDGKDEPRRLYPPATGDAPIGPRLSHAAFARDSSWILIQSPLGWGRVSVAAGELGTLSLKPIDLTEGSLALSPDDTHVAFVRPQNGQGYQNGANVLAVNLETSFAQVLDHEHLYTGVLFLPNGMPVGIDANGALWILTPSERFPYFTPPAPKGGGRVTSYAVDLGLSTLAWTVVRGLDGKSPKAELWSVTAPAPPRSKHQGP